MDKYRANFIFVKWVLQASTYVPFSLFFHGIYPFTASCDLHLTLAFNLSLTWTKKPEENAAEVHSIRSLFPLIYHNCHLKPRYNEDTAKTVTISIAFGSLKLLYIRVRSTVKDARWLQYLKKKESRISTDNSHLFHNASLDPTINCKRKLQYLRLGVLIGSTLMGMCRWMGSHFHNWIDY